MAGLRTHGKRSRMLDGLVGQSAPRPAAEVQAEEAMQQGSTERLMRAMELKKEALRGDTPMSTTRSNPKVSSGPRQFETVRNRRDDERMAP